MSIKVKCSKRRIEVRIGSQSPYASANTVRNPFSKRGYINLGIKATEEIIEELLVHETLHIVIDALFKENAERTAGVYYSSSYEDFECLNFVMMNPEQFQWIRGREVIK